MPTENRVYKYRCYPSRDSGQIQLAEQILGQAWNYRDHIRRIYNDEKREIRAAFTSGDAAGHVAAFAHDRRNAAIRAARKPTSRGHLIDAGTYWLIEKSLAQASKASRLDPIKRARWDGTGRIGAAIQSVDQFPVDEWNHNRVVFTPPLDRRGHAEITIFVGDFSRRRSLSWAMKMSRPLPEGGMIKQIAVQRVRTGHRFAWEALITVCSEPVVRDVDASGVVGVDIGWRSEEGGQRVATHDGSSDRGVLITDTLRSFLYSDAVRSTRDSIFEDVKDYARKSGLPGAEHAHLWRDKDRVHRLERSTRDFGLYWWRERDRHLEDIECGVRSRAIRRRLDMYRVYADRLAKRFRYVALEDMPMSTWVGSAETGPLERRRSTAALGLLQTIIAQRFGLDRVDWVPAAFTSMTCSDCGYVRDEAVGPQAEWCCVSCGVVHHQDENAATVIRQTSERWLDAGNPPRARKRKLVTSHRKKDADAIGTGDDRLLVISDRVDTSEAAE